MALRDANRDFTYREKRTDSPRESLSPRGESRTNRTLWVPWDTRQTACAEILGYTTVEADAVLGTKYLSRHIPWQHPDWPDFPMYAADISELVGFLARGRSAGDVPRFKEGLATVSITTRKYDVRTDPETFALLPAGAGIGLLDTYFLRYVEVTEKSQSNYVSLPPNAALVWDSDGRPASTFAYVNTYHTLITVVWREVPVTAYRERQVGGAGPLGFMDMVGCANSGDLGHTASLFGFKPAGTVTQGCPSREVVRMGNGALAYDVTIPYRFDPYGANYRFRHDKPGGPGYDKLRRPDGTLLFPFKDLAQAYEIV
jgi:hypothetical protein